MNDIKKIKQLANNIRKHAVTMTSLGGSSHIGSILSIADILAVLYGSILKYNSKDPKWIDRDRFILSKGHAGAGVYAVLAESQGFQPQQKLKVEPMTLKALVRERIEAGKEMPTEIFNVFVGNKTTIKRKQ